MRQRSFGVVVRRSTLLSVVVVVIVFVCFAEPGWRLIKYYVGMRGNKVREGPAVKSDVATNQHELLLHRRVEQFAVGRRDGVPLVDLGLEPVVRPAFIIAE